MSQPEEPTLSRSQVLRLLGLQGLVLLLLSFTWLFFDRAIPLFQDIRLESSLLAWGLGGALGLLALSCLIFAISPPLRQALLKADRLFLGQLKARDAFYLAVVSGVSEEIFFRGILQAKLGLAPASLLFGLLHIPGWNVSYGLWAAVAGFYLGYAYDLTGNLLVAILIHILNNALALILWLRIRPR